jgi:hypothetical protein
LEVQLHLFLIYEADGGELHAPAASPMEKEPPGPESVVKKFLSLPLPGIETRYNLVTILAELLPF